MLSQVYVGYSFLFEGSTSECGRLIVNKKEEHNLYAPPKSPILNFIFILRALFIYKSFFQKTQLPVNNVYLKKHDQDS